MNDGELIEAVRLLALRNALRPSYDYFLRRIFRRYSERYKTPLHHVQNLPLDYVLQNFYEGYYESLSEEDLHEAAEDLVEDKEQKAREEAEAKAADDKFMETLVKREMAKEKKRNPTKALTDAVGTFVEAMKPPPPIEPGLGPKDDEEILISFGEEDFESRDSLGIPKQPTGRRGQK